MKWFLAFALYICLAPAAVWAAGPFGGGVRGLAVVESTGEPAWAATDHGLFRHHGEAWSRVAALGMAPLSGVIVRGDRVLVAAAGAGLRASDDLGTSWDAPVGELRGRYGRPVRDVLCLVADPVQTQRLLLGSAGQGLFSSDDAGLTWNQLSGGLETAPSQAWFATTALPPTASVPLLMGTDGGGLFARTSTGWQPWGEGLPPRLRVRQLVRSPLDANGLALATRGHGLWRSADGGLTWTRVRKGRFGVVGTVAFDGQGALFAAFANEGVVRVAGGAVSRPQAVGVDELVVLVRAGATGVFGGLNHDGVVHLDSEGVARGFLNRGLDGTQVFSLLAPGPDGSLWAGDANGAFFSGDGGAGWEPRNRGLLGTAVAALLLHRGQVLAGTAGNGVFRWETANSSWVAESQGLGTANTISAFDQDMTSGVLYVGTEGGVLRRDVGNPVWRTCNRGLPGGGVWVVACSPTVAGRVWAAGQGALYRSDDGAESWAPLGPAQPVALRVVPVAGGDRLWVVEPSRLWSLESDGTRVERFAAPPGERLRCVVPAAEKTWLGGSDGLRVIDRAGAHQLWHEASILTLLRRPDGVLFAGTDGAGVVRFRVE